MTKEESNKFAEFSKIVTIGPEPVQTPAEVDSRRLRRPRPGDDDGLYIDDETSYIPTISPAPSF